MSQTANQNVINMNQTDINPSEVLYLTIKKVFFDQILSGEKKEEYRDGSDYWVRRLCVIKNGKIERFKPFYYVRLCVGYNKDREEALVEIKDMKVEYYDAPPEGLTTNDGYFVLYLGKVISKKLNN